MANYRYTFEITADNEENAKKKIIVIKDNTNDVRDLDSRKMILLMMKI